MHTNNLLLIVWIYHFKLIPCLKEFPISSMPYNTTFLQHEIIKKRTIPPHSTIVSTHYCLFRAQKLMRQLATENALNPSAQALPKVVETWVRAHLNAKQWIMIVCCAANDVTLWLENRFMMSSCSWDCKFIKLSCQDSHSVFADLVPFLVCHIGINYVTTKFFVKATTPLTPNVPEIHPMTYGQGQEYHFLGHQS